MSTRLVLTIFLTALSSRGLHGQSAGTFSVTGSMTTARAWHTATLLPDGRVLIAGGENVPATATASAEIYDPSTGTFRGIGNMTVARSEHTATLLANGKVLIAGGDGSQKTSGPDGPHLTAELFDPKTETFTATGYMVADRSYAHVAARLPDGRVFFVASEYTGAGAQIYDPSTGTFAAAASPYSVSFGISTATSLTDGRVLVNLGDDLRGELYDPQAGGFSLTFGARVPWVGGPAVALLNGQVLFPGGYDPYYLESAVAEVYDPSNQFFVPVGNLTAPRMYQSATLLPDGSALVAGANGDDGNGLNFALASAELYDPVKKVFTRTGDMNTARGLHTATLLKNGKVLITGGIQAVPIAGRVDIASAEIYTPASLIAAPVLFSLSGDGNGQGAIWHAATGAIASKDSPAVAGEILSLYTNNLAPGGAIPPLVAVGGKIARVTYFGAAPGYPGYFQVNFQQPSGVVPGTAIPVHLSYLDRWTNEVTIGAQ
jgi:hypothetical protein